MEIAMGLSAMLALALGLLLMLSSITIDGRPTSNTVNVLRQARQRCFQAVKLSANQRLQLDKMNYEDQPHVRGYVYCFWRQLQVWQDNAGFSAPGIVNRFGGPIRLNEEVIIPKVNDCNQRNRKINPQEWCYRAFICVLKSPVGDWYRRLMSDVINNNA